MPHRQATFSSKKLALLTSLVLALTLSCLGGSSDDSGSASGGFSGGGGESKFDEARFDQDTFE